MSEKRDRRISLTAGAEYALAVYGIALDEDERGWFAQEMVRTAVAIDRVVSTEHSLFDVRMRDFDDLLRREEDGK